MWWNEKHDADFDWKAAIEEENKITIAAYKQKEEKMATMTIEKLTRAIPEWKEITDAAYLQLADEAEKLLGYGVLKATLHKPLAKALATLEIAVLDAAQVERYKNKKEDEATDDDMDGEWYPYEIGDYTQPIPEFVLAKALEIKKAVPEVNLHIEQIKLKPDPFLVATLDSECYYIEVWEEPEFEGRLTKAATQI